METLASESTAGTSSAREAGRSLGLPPFYIRNILQGVLNQYPYKLQSCKLLLSDTVEKGAFARFLSVCGVVDGCYGWNWQKEATVQNPYLSILPDCLCSERILKDNFTKYIVDKFTPDVLLNGNSREAEAKLSKFPSTNSLLD
ncbi:hypothetical protein NPIL_583331 [Nephila pilipes]|uniref:Uncharacterized protein n=1 Tax=Nephila pilipes TaxID=299642 RepID=A0A8X6UDF0_NEPPI|nr:hypothetical protein NPIL_583331 [Nephila pilipes]